MRKIVVLAALVTLAVPRHAFADITGFLGVNTTPSNRQTRGFAIGAGLLIVGFEFEYASTNEDLSTGAPSLTTGLGSILLQTPVALGGFQPYFETGGGYYREELGARSDQGFALGTGGGVKISLAGPLRLRVDYRVLNLGSGALTSPAHRLYAGINLKF
jgi:opacity protein-like surface antigen